MIFLLPENARLDYSEHEFLVVHFDGDGDRAMAQGRTGRIKGGGVMDGMYRCREEVLNTSTDQKAGHAWAARILRGRSGIVVSRSREDM